MAEKRKVKRRKDEDFDFSNKEAMKPTKEEIKVAKWMKKHVAVKKTKFAGHNVEYFTGKDTEIRVQSEITALVEDFFINFNMTVGSKAVDALLDSEWGQKKGDKEPFFNSRQDIVNFLNNMLRHKLFHRAKKVPVSEQELKKKMKKKDKKPGEKDDKKKKEDETAESSHAEGRDIEDKKNQPDERQKKCKKIRLEMHFDQLFVDNLDAYVWIFDPIPFYYWIIGFLVVIGAIGICLFPLWPPTVRMGVQYLSMAAAGLLILILALAVIRLIVFCLVWLLTCGTFHLWLFPNLTEDVGFFASFWPLYEYQYGKQIKSGKNKKKKKKAKDSDNEEEAENEKFASISEKAENDQSHEYDENTAKDDSDSGSRSEDDLNEDAKHSQPEEDDQHRMYSEDEEDYDQEESEEEESKESEDSSSYKQNESPESSPRKSKQKDRSAKSNKNLSRNDSEETDTESSSQHSQTGKDFEFVDREDSDVKS